MIPLKRIQEIAGEVASANLHDKSVMSVLSEPTADSEGREALRITIVLNPKSIERIGGDSLLDTLVQIQARLRDAGEERLAIVEYATQEELDERGDTES